MIDNKVGKDEDWYVCNKCLVFIIYLCECTNLITRGNLKPKQRDINIKEMIMRKSCPSCFDRNIDLDIKSLYRIQA